MKEIEHGTYGGWQHHLKYGVPTTPECGCEAARNTYMQEWRAAHPEARKRAQAHTKRRQRALSRLARLHHAEYERLLAEEERRDQTS